MAVTTYWAPNQGAIAQVETYVFTAPNSVGNTYNATLNGKTVTYRSVSGDTATTAATALFNLLNITTSIPAEFAEIQFTNPSNGTMTATARVPGTPFANVSGTSAGLVLSTGNGLSNGIATTHTTANASPSDVNDSQNWLRTNLSTNPPTQTRSLPQNGDDVVVSGTSVPMLWNLDQLAAVQFNTYTRWQSMTGQIGLPVTNANGYTEWRARDFKFVGPQGSVPSGGLVMICGYGAGNGPPFEAYDLGSQKFSLQAIAANQAQGVGGFGIFIRGVHTDNAITALNGAAVAVAVNPQEVANLNTVVADSGATVSAGKGVTFTTSSSSAASSVTSLGGGLVLNSAPASITLSSGAQLVVATDALTFATITAQGGCSVIFLAGGTITTLTFSNSCTLDKSQDARALTITNSTIDGDTCVINDPLNAITFTNATTVKQAVSAGPFIFTGTRTVKVT